MSATFISVLSVVFLVIPSIWFILVSGLSALTSFIAGVGYKWVDRKVTEANDETEMIGPLEAKVLSRAIKKHAWAFMLTGFISVLMFSGYIALFGTPFVWALWLVDKVVGKLLVKWLTKMSEQVGEYDLDRFSDITDEKTRGRLKKILKEEDIYNA